MKRRGYRHAMPTVSPLESGTASFAHLRHLTPKQFVIDANVPSRLTARLRNQAAYFCLSVAHVGGIF